MSAMISTCMNDDTYHELIYVMLREPVGYYLNLEAFMDAEAEKRGQRTWTEYTDNVLAKLCGMCGGASQELCTDHALAEDNTWD